MCCRHHFEKKIYPEGIESKIQDPPCRPILTEVGKGRGGVVVSVVLGSYLRGMDEETGSISEGFSVCVKVHVYMCTHVRACVDVCV